MLGKLEVLRVGFFDIFRRKKEEPQIGIDTNFDPGSNPMMHNNPDMNDPLGLQNQSYNPGLESRDSMGAVNLSTMGMASMNAQSNLQAFQGQSAGSGIDKDLQILSLKLDAIKAEIDSINQRVKNIENIAEREQQTASQQKRWY